MSIFDIHIHACGELTKTAFDPPSLLKQMDAAGVSGGCVFSGAPRYWGTDRVYSPKERLDEILRCCEGFQDRLYPILWCIRMKMVLWTLWKKRQSAALWALRLSAITSLSMKIRAWNCWKKSKRPTDPCCFTAVSFGMIRCHVSTTAHCIGRLYAESRDCDFHLPIVPGHGMMKLSLCTASFALTTVRMRPSTVRCFWT